MIVPTFEDLTVKAVKKNILDDSIRLYMFQKIPGDRVVIGQPPILEEMAYDDIRAIDPFPVVTLGPPSSQYLMDTLWYCGVRPSDVRYGSDVVQAKEDHIKDLQARNRFLEGQLGRALYEFPRGNMVPPGLILRNLTLVERLRRKRQSLKDRREDKKLKMEVGEQLEKMRAQEEKNLPAK